MAAARLYGGADVAEEEAREPTAAEKRYGNSPRIQEASRAESGIPTSRRKVTITQAMADKLNPKSAVPEQEGTESRGVDPMKLRKDNEELEKMEDMRDRSRKKYGTSDDD